MARVRVIQNSLNSGEWSPRLDGRTDLEKYKSSVNTMLNAFCFKHGGAQRRPGTRFVNEVKDSSKETRLFSFEFSTVQAYIIEAGETYFRFYANGARLESPPGTPVEVSTPYLESELFSINHTQSADVMYLAHPAHPPMKLSRTSLTAFALSPIDTSTGPFLTEQTDIQLTSTATTGAVTITSSLPIFDPLHVGSVWRFKGASVWGSFLITALTDGGTVQATILKDLDSVGPSVAYAEAAWSNFRGWPGVVTLFQQRLWWASTTSQPDTFWGSQTGNYENQDPGTGMDNEACTFTLASDKVNAIQWMVPKNALLIGTVGQEWEVTGGDPTVPITPSNVTAKGETTNGSSSVSPLQIQNTTLFLQRAGRKIREFSFEFSTNSYVAPDLSVLAEHITDGGITQMEYQQELDSIVWAIRNDGTLLGMTYERPQDVVGWHRHITGTRQDTSDGLFESIAVIPLVDRDQSWFVVQRYIGGNFKRYIEYFDTQAGYFGPLNTDSAITVGLASIPIISISAGPVGGDTRVTYFVPSPGIANLGLVAGTQITILNTNPAVFSQNGILQTIESIVDSQHFTVVLGGAGFPSSGTGGFLFVGAGTLLNVITGLDHLEGEFVDIIGDGHAYPPQLVSAGQVVDIEPPIVVGEIGLHFGTKIVTQRPEAGEQSGTAQGGHKRFNQIFVRLYNSIGVTINGDLITEDMTPFSGDSYTSNVGWDRDGRITIEQTNPLPLTVLAVFGVLSAND